MSRSTKIYSVDPTELQCSIFKEQHRTDHVLQLINQQLVLYAFLCL